MSKINILPAQIYNRIAAGEVVDRPYSVVKELVENAIDAGATQIEIYVENGGKQLVRVVDNGCGIGADDLHAAFLPHATSKIAKAEDIDEIMTLGFRGEAIASIAAVSKMTITSKTAEGECYSLTSDGGKLGEITQAAGDNGTEVKVEMLFFNTPVRLGFLKSDKAEEADISTFVSRFILCRPEISFTYYVNGKKTLQSFGGGAEEALVGIYGASILSNCYQIDAKKHGLRIRGYIGNQHFSKPNKSYQCVFLNGRFIVNPTISAAISNAYNSYLMKRQYPFYVLYIDVPTEIVDVNVHPNKADVRFSDNQIVYGCIYSVISAVLDGNSKALEYLVSDKQLGIKEETPIQEEVPLQSVEEKPLEKKEEEPSQKQEEKPFTAEELLGFSYEDAKKEVNAASKKTEQKKPFVGFFGEGVEEPRWQRVGQSGNFGLPRQPIKEKRDRQAEVEMLRKRFPDLYQGDSSVGVQEKVEYTDYFVSNKRELHELELKAMQEKLDLNLCRYIGKAFNTYLLYEREEEVLIIDQHAAHERLLFDKLREDMRFRRVMQQPMLTPFVLNINSFESAFIREHISYLREAGFDVEEFGNNAFKVSAVPTDLQRIDLNRFFNGLLGEVAGFRAIRLPDLLRDKLASMACKMAVKGGMNLTMEEQKELLVKLEGNMGLKCPHGRPIVVKLTKTQIEKMFKRIV